MSGIPVTCRAAGTRITPFAGSFVVMSMLAP